MVNFLDANGLSGKNGAEVNGKQESVTYVSGTNCYLSVGSFTIN
jgi:hypothetical protein